MLIDLILDRRDGIAYSPREFYNSCQQYGATFGDIVWDIARAMDAGTEANVRAALCRYILTQGYNPSICSYINSVTWLD